MRFSDNGYYLEEYTKCDNCGVLIYRKPIHVSLDSKPRRYCSDWCVEWDIQRSADTFAPANSKNTSGK